ncbi:Phosphoribosylanthranilate isomerase [hydrothermal vent metagenome]|uniref:phosphoribosylanthranilate isomerase n=1 Tax=hydrothermal vent metagenome TaxID=652676 RepID=A0A3B1ASM9_9ZZZZ
MRTRVKICGITREQDALDAVRLGADAIGLVFYSPSPRAVTAEQAITIVRQLPPFVTVVGLFVNATRDEIAAIVERVRIDLLQFHGDEPPEQCAGFGCPWIKAVRMRDSIDLHAVRRRYADASSLLLDAYQPGKAGGTGAVFDWSKIPDDLRSSVILAGGLTPENIALAIRQVAPYAVDVSGGVEQEKGIKNADKIAAFMSGVKSANP